MSNDTERTSRGDAPMTVVHTANGECEAQGIRSALEAAGIPAALDVQSVTKLFATTIDGLGAVKILVPEDRVDEARAIIETPAEPFDGRGDSAEGKDL